jgi:acetoin utilization deacetylase AcuC-like enzyme
MTHARVPCGGRLRSLWRSLRLAFARAAALCVYHPDYAVDFPESMYDRRRGERIVAFLQQAGVLGKRDLFVPRPASARKLLRVHDAAYLDSLQTVEALLPVVGFPVDDRFLESFLHGSRRATGGTVLATDLAWRRGGIAVNLGGGFHHAETARGQGFCVFNDVAVAIANWRRHGGEGRVLVVDLDLHDGDGTRQVFREDPDVFTLSIHNRDLGDPEAVASSSVALGDDVEDARYLDAVHEHVGRAFEEVRPRLVYYLAGADPAEDDRLGNWRISADGMLQRDRFVLDRVRASGDGVPTVMLLAGGYGSGAWRYTARSLSAVLNGGIALEPPRTEHLMLARFRRRFRRIHPDELSADPQDGDPWNLAPEDVLPALGGAPRTRFLNFYTRHGIEVGLERYGLLERVRSQGLRRLRVDLDLDPVAGDTLKLISLDWPDVPLMELRARRDSSRVPGMELLVVEWLRLQNPAATFTPGRPRLPGQDHPGMGLLKEVFAMLILMCERLELDGLLIVAGHYHLVALSDDLLRFLDPDPRGPGLGGGRRGRPGGCRHRATGALGADHDGPPRARSIPGLARGAQRGEAFLRRPRARSTIPVADAPPGVRPGGIMGEARTRAARYPIAPRRTRS